MLRASSLTAGGAVLLLGGAAVVGELNWRLPGRNQGYEPVQPVEYSHRLHAGELRIDCLFCHTGAETSRRAGVPAVSTCMSCHATVTAGWDVMLAEKQAALAESRDPKRIVSDRLRPLFDAAGLGADGKPDPSKTPKPVEWVRVHALPSHAAFSHERHVGRGVPCQACHGPVETMERVRQHAPLTMGWCVECHRANAAAGPGLVLPPAARAADHVSTDCAACHY
ncbi:MAG: hypothetical protein HMLKMBBP_01972 [Planctomycetes bacterium]|nr:hypothetical protein [Planctomycetota bacterium]